MCIRYLQTSFVQDDVKYYFLTRENELIILFLSYRQPVWQAFECERSGVAREEYTETKAVPPLSLAHRVLACPYFQPSLVLQSPSTQTIISQFNRFACGVF